MTTTCRRMSLAALVAGATILGATRPAPVLAQEKKEVTDGFFDVPHREGPPAWGLPEYLTTSGMAGLAIFILCKSSRRT